MLDARHPDPAQRDLGRATAWINEAIAISTILPDPRERAFKLGFDQNGKALIELRQGRLDAALDLVESAIALADELPDGAHPLHRMVLLANRAQLLAAMGHPKEALHDLDRAIAYDPAVPDHYLDRGNLRLRLGHTDAALADYETAIAVSPPLPEAYYNRGELRLGQGDLEGAKADFDHVIDLDPGFLNAYVNRAGILEMLDDHEAARADVAAGLALDPRNPHLHAVLGQLETAQGDHRGRDGRLRRGPRRRPRPGLHLGQPGHPPVRIRRPRRGRRRPHEVPGARRGRRRLLQPRRGPARPGPGGGRPGGPEKGPRPRPRRPRHPARPGFVIREYVLFWTGSTISFLGTRATAIAYPLLALAVLGSPVAAGLIASFGMVPYLVLYLPGGCTSTAATPAR